MQELLAVRAHSSFLPESIQGTSNHVHCMQTVRSLRYILRDKTTFSRPLSRVLQSSLRSSFMHRMQNSKRSFYLPNSKTNIGCFTAGYLGYRFPRPKNLKRLCAIFERLWIMGTSKVCGQRPKSKCGRENGINARLR